MNKVKQLIKSYSEFVAIPWRNDAAAAQRVVFCVYNEQEELRLLVRVGEFELATRDSGHEWALFDLTDSFAEWITKQRYAKSYFQKPHLLVTLLPKYKEYITEEFKNYLIRCGVDDNYVVAIQGVGTLFGFLKVKDVVDELAPLVPGRLLVFFPGSFEDNNYRLLDGYDGWNYLAIPITADK